MLPRGGTASSCVSCNREFPQDSQQATANGILETAIEPAPVAASAGGHENGAENSLSILNGITGSRVRSTGAMAAFSHVTSAAGIQLPPYPSLPPISTVTAAGATSETPRGEPCQTVCYVLSLEAT